jgi:DNA-binding LytR/AlgR family response regulator
MARKLRTIIVDDDAMTTKMIINLSDGSNSVEITKTFLNPQEFIDTAPMLDFDLCVIDIEMPEMSGLVVAQILGKKPFIFITSSDSKLRSALSLCPVDIVTKPIMKERLDIAFEKAHELFIDKQEYDVFNIAESKKKIKLHLPDILLVTTDTIDPRNKIVYMGNGEKYTLMDYTLTRLLEMCPLLVQVSRSEAISIEAINQVEHEVVTVKGLNGIDIPKYVNLGRSFRESFKERVFYKKA